MRRLLSWRFAGVSVGLAGLLFAAGIVFWGGFNTAMEATNTMEFCISCHEMRNTVYKEYTQTIHFQNRTGVRATCPDCHVPKDWIHKMMRKVQASNELYHKLMGTVDTPEKFETHRLDMAKRVWVAMKATDSRECRNCHTFDGMAKDAQKATAWRRHQGAQKKGETCIDCHKGIAHKDISALYEEETSPDKKEAAEAK